MAAVSGEECPLPTLLSVCLQSQCPPLSSTIWRLVSPMNVRGYKEDDRHSYVGSNPPTLSENGKKRMMVVRD